MIRSFRSRDAERLLRREPAREFPADLQRPALRKLLMLNRAQTLQDLRVPPGNHLEALRGDRVGQHSIRVNEKWRICFRWAEGDAHDVDIVDYHRG